MRAAKHASDVLDTLAGRIAEAGERIEEVAKREPLIPIACAAAVGALIGAVAMRRAGRFLFFAAAGFVGTELWKREGGVDVKALLDRALDV